MTLTPFDEWAFLRRKVASGAATPGDRERMETLQDRMIAPAVARAMREAQPQIDAAIARRRAAVALARWRAQQTQPRRR